MLYSKLVFTFKTMYFLISAQLSKTKFISGEFSFMDVYRIKFQLCPKVKK